MMGQRSMQKTTTYNPYQENKEQELETGDSIFIPKESKHRAWNKTNEIVKFIEVQTGSYFGEDDITRYEDDFNRL